VRAFVASTDYESPDGQISMKSTFWRPGGEQEFERLDRGQPIFLRLKSQG
jgi:hypothetical protein